MPPGPVVFPGPNDNRHLVEVAEADLANASPDVPVGILVVYEEHSRLRFGHLPGATQQAIFGRIGAARRGGAGAPVADADANGPAGGQADRGRFQEWATQGVRGALAAFQSFDFP